MKKLSVKQRQTAIRRAQGAGRKARTPLQAEVNERRVIEAPPILSFGTSYDETAKFLASVRRAVDGSARDRSLLLVDPKRVREMDPAAALCLTAEMDRWQRQAEGLRLAPTTIEAWHKKFIRQLADMGFFALLGSPVPQKLRSGGPGSARWIRFCSDDTLRPETSANFKRSIEPHIGAMSPFGLSLYRSLQEAIGNAIEHAYPEGARNALSPVGNRWWLTGAVDIKRRRLRVIVLDHGVSIPETLPRSGLLERGMGLLSTYIVGDPFRDDGEMLAAAMEYGRSRHASQHRGKGLRDMIRLLGDDPSNTLTIISRKGVCRLAGGRLVPETRTNPLLGTLIDWDLAFPATVEPSKRRGT